MRIRRKLDIIAFAVAGVALALIADRVANGPMDAPLAVVQASP